MNAFRGRGGSGPVGGDPEEPGGRSGGGGIGRFFGRVFENPENPLGWSVRVFTAAGIAVRIHLFTILFVTFMLLWSIPQSNAGAAFMALAMGSMLGLVLLHEFGHCFACRYAGGTADRIVMLPIGGLALIRPRHHWRSHLISTVGGPAVNAVLAPVTAVALLAAGMQSTVLFSPLNPMATLSDPAFTSGSTAVFWLKVGLWWVHYVNLLLLAFNVLLPAYPLDGGRIVQALLWRRLGYERGTEIAVTIGLAAGMTLAVVGLVANNAMLVVIAVFSLWSCWTERQRLRAGAGVLPGVAGVGGAVDEADVTGAMVEEDDPWEERRRAKEAEAARKEQEELDRVLEKISASGMNSLSAGEKRLLRRATEKKRQADEPG
ncbi:MAG: site-2 protease family protein [Planctomycetota bacterium]|nr:site-2 protease family protein [Planctomycetota bacterium]